LVKFDQKNFPKIYPNQRLSTIRQKNKQMSYLDICFYKLAFELTFHLSSMRLSAAESFEMAATEKWENGPHFQTFKLERICICNLAFKNSFQF
jgi:hypothetical protein